MIPLESSVTPLAPAIAARRRQLMPDEVQRIEDQLKELVSRFDEFSALLHKELGAAPLRSEKMAELQSKTDVLEAKLETLEVQVAEYVGALKLVKWLVPLIGTGTGAIGASIAAQLFGT